LLPLAPQVSQIGDAAPIEREAVTLPLDHAFGLEFTDVRSRAARCAANADAETVTGLADRRPETTGG